MMFIRGVLFECRKTLSSPMFYLGSIGITVISLLNIADELSRDANAPLFYYFTGRSSLGAFQMVILFFMTIVFGTNFCIDWNQNFFQYAMIRQGKYNYALSKVTASVFMTITSCILGYALFASITSLLISPIPELQEELLTLFIINKESPFTSILTSKLSWSYYVFSILPEAFMYAFLSVFSLFVSTYTTNRFVVISSPIILYFSYNYIFGTLGLPDILYWTHMEQGVAPDSDIGFNLLMTFAYYLLGIIFFSILFTKGIERKVEYEK